VASLIFEDILDGDTETFKSDLPTCSGDSETEHEDRAKSVSCNSYWQEQKQPWSGLAKLVFQNDNVCNMIHAAYLGSYSSIIQCFLQA